MSVRVRGCPALLPCVLQSTVRNWLLLLLHLPLCLPCEPHVATVQHAEATVYVSGEFVVGDIRVLVNMLLNTGVSMTVVYQGVVSKLGVMHEMYPATRLGVSGPVSAGCDQLGLLGAVEWIKICGNSLCSRRIT